MNRREEQRLALALQAKLARLYRLADVLDIDVTCVVNALRRGASFNRKEELAASWQPAIRDDLTDS